MTTFRVHADRPVRLVAAGDETMVVKRYVAGGAAAIYTEMCDLWASPFGERRRPPGMPAPLGLDPVQQEIQMQWLDGDPIGTRGGLGRSVELLPEVARLLADLHGSGVTVPRRRDAAALIRSGRRKVEELGSSAGVLRLGRLVIDALDGARPQAGPLVVSHGDFSPRNVLLTASGLALIDFDRLQMSAPERDISYWGAWTWVTLLISGERPDWRVADDLAAHYRRLRTGLADDSSSWAFYRAVALLRIAHGWSALQSAPEICAEVLAEALNQLHGRPMV